LADCPPESEGWNTDCRDPWLKSSIIGQRELSLHYRPFCGESPSRQQVSAAIVICIAAADRKPGHRVRHQHRTNKTTRGIILDSAGEQRLGRKRDQLVVFCFNLLQYAMMDTAQTECRRGHSAYVWPTGGRRILRILQRVYVGLAVQQVPATGFDECYGVQKDRF